MACGSSFSTDCTSRTLSERLALNGRSSRCGWEWAALRDSPTQSPSRSSTTCACCRCTSCTTTSCGCTQTLCMAMAAVVTDTLHNMVLDCRTGCARVPAPKRPRPEAKNVLHTPKITVRYCHASHVAGLPGGGGAMGPDPGNEGPVESPNTRSGPVRPAAPAWSPHWSRKSRLRRH